MSLVVWFLRGATALPDECMVRGGSEPWARDMLMCGRGVWLRVMNVASRLLAIEPLELLEDEGVCVPFLPNSCL